jgi:hypothetical protein
MVHAEVMLINLQHLDRLPVSWNEKSFIARYWRNFDSRFIRPFVTDIGSVPCSVQIGPGRLEEEEVKD